MYRRLGISLYPNHSQFETDLKYIKSAKTYGFDRIFMSMLEISDGKSNTVNRFNKIIKETKKLDYEVILDIAPDVLELLGASYDDLSIFKNIGADGLRLDAGFDGKKEAMITFNTYDLIIELNMSNNVAYLDNIMTHQPNTPFLYGCHNFYPQEGTGLPLEFFEECSKRFKKYGLKTAAFVSSQFGEVGPWDINDGLPTLEMHRDLPIDVQAKHLFATGYIDDVIIGNGYATEEELKNLGKLNRYQIEFTVEFDTEINPIEKEIILDNQHFRRGDITSRMVRSTEVRKKYTDKNEPHTNQLTFKKGDVVIGNSNFGKYENELQIVLEEHTDSRKNLVGRIIDEEIILLDYIEPWTKFRFIESTNNKYNTRRIING